jgi:hypothetical protein
MSGMSSRGLPHCVYREMGAGAVAVSTGGSEVGVEEAVAVAVAAG